ncbi:MAG: hypothetical protein PWQ96_78 [Clostridia bacterium]|jgi:hypothetical protein|nr:hypothetical protein [Clostridiales bacterium]MDK2984436.1 hypothetical protein [Clostridia bacterium]
MTLSRAKLAQYQKQCKSLEKLYKSSGRKEDISQIAKQRREADKLLKKLFK